MEFIKRWRLLPLFILSSVAYVFISYGMERSNYPVFFTLFALLLACYYGQIKWANSSSEIAYALGAALIFRCLLLFSVPNLSDDIFRFIWDGNLLIHGMNPFNHTPVWYIQHGLPDFLSVHLYQNLNSQDYYTVYPPVSQYIYGLGAAISGTQILRNAIVIKSTVLAFEAGTFWVMKQLLNYFKRSPKWLLLYALNPLIILELTGNTHLEGVMIFFLLAAYLSFLKERFWMAALCFALAVNTKLIPLIIIPYLIFSLEPKQWIGLLSILAGSTVILHIPFLDATFFQHFGDSLGLYFHSFEFNASLFYLVRGMGYLIFNNDIIQVAAPILAGIAGCIIIIVGKKYQQKSLKNLPLVYTISLGIYYLCSTTVHPWYVSSLVAFVPLTGLIFPLAWSAIIPLTYITYATPAYKENLWLVALEYLIVLMAICYDWYRRNQAVNNKIRQGFKFVPDT